MLILKIIEQDSLNDECRQNFPLSDFFSFDIRPYTSAVKFEGGENILEEGRQVSYLYYLADGRAKLFLSHENGRISLINFLNAPCFIGEMELIGAQSVSSGVTAITPCLCYRIHVSECKDAILGDTKFLRRLCLFLGQKAIANTDVYSKNQSYPLENRLANFILLTSYNGVYRERHLEASEFLGVTYRHLLYVLAGFVKRGILEKTTQGYFIRNIDELQLLARM